MLFEQIQKNKRKTWLLYFLAFIVIELLVAILYIVFNSGDFFPLSKKTLINAIAPIISISLTWWAVIGMLTLYKFNFGMEGVMRANNAREITEQDNPMLWHIVEDMAMVGQIPMPRVFIVDTDVQNAFATGSNPEKAGLAVTQGLLDNLNREELEAVVGHEITHIRNYDIRVTMLMSCIIIGLTFINSFASYFAFWGESFWDDDDDDDDNSSVWAGMVIFIYILSYVGIIASSLINLAMSRNREYLADAGSVELTRNPQGMINALLKISGKSELEVKPQYTGMYFASTKTTSLLDDHPSIEDRIQAIEKL